MTQPDLNFENHLWKAADKLRKKVEVHQYKYVVLGLIFLRYLSFVFNERYKELKEKHKNDPDLPYILKDIDYYYSAGALYVPEKARWEYIQQHANQHNIGEIIDNAIEILENEYPDQLQNVIPKIYTSIKLSPEDLAYLINIFSSINFGDGHKSKDIFGRIYEYFLSKFTEAEGKKGGEFYTPRSLTKLIVEILDIKEGRIFDSCCGSGGFFVAALEKLEKENIPDYYISIYGQESKEFVWKLAKMNLAIRGAEGDIKVGDSYHEDMFPELKAQFVLSNPPFNDSGWGADRIRSDDPRFPFGIPDDNNANFAWIQIYLYHLAENGKAGFVMANGALSSSGTDGNIRKKIIQNDLIYGIIATPPKLFYSVTLPVSLWFLRKNKPPHMKNKVLFINAKKLFKPISRKQVTFTDEHINKIVQKFRLFESGADENQINEIGFAKVATLQDIENNDFILTPGRYVGIKLDEDEIPFEDKMKNFADELQSLLQQEQKLNQNIKNVFENLGFEIDDK